LHSTSLTNAFKHDSICFVHRELRQLDLEAFREGKESRAACMFEL